MICFLQALVCFVLKCSLTSGLATSSKQQIALWINSAATVQSRGTSLSKRIESDEGAQSLADYKDSQLQKSSDECSGERLKYVTEARAGSGWMGKGRLLDDLRVRYKAVDVLVHVPTKEQVAAWGPKVVVMIEGPSLMPGDSTHYYNMITIILSHMLRYVAEPLVRYGHASNTTIVLHKENAKWHNCAHNYSAPETQQELHFRREHNIGFDSNLHSPCKSALEMLPDMLPEISIEFSNDSPYCSDLGKCFGTSKAAKDATLLVLPFSRPVQQLPCASAMVDDMRKHFSSSAVVRSHQVTLIARGHDLQDNEEAGNDYAYDRNFDFIPNMNELASALKIWSSQHNLEFEMLEFERMPFSKQVEAIHRTKILIGAEGAGLANMVFLQDVNMSHVVELNWEGGKTQDYQEYPMLARQVGVHLHMYVFGHFGSAIDPSKLTAVLDKMV